MNTVFLSAAHFFGALCVLIVLVELVVEMLLKIDAGMPKGAAIFKFLLMGLVLAPAFAMLAFEALKWMWQ